jgi:ketosteroid isomerase-like protein
MDEKTLRAVADRVQIEALRGEFTDAAMMNDYDRLAALFTPDGALRMPNVPVDLIGHDQIRAWRERREAMVELFVQNTHPGSVEIDGDTATGRAYMHELIRLRSGAWHVNHAIYHDRYERGGDGWRFAERVYEIRHLDGATPAAASSFADPATEQSLQRAAGALRSHGFAAEILDDAAAARARVKDLIPEGVSVFTASSETVRLSGIEADINDGGRYRAIKPQVLAMDRATAGDDIRWLLASPDVVVGSVAAVTETGSLVVASASGSQLPAYAGGAARVLLIAGAQKVVADLDTALRRLHEHALPLENTRALAVYGTGSAVNRLLVLNADLHPGRVTVLLLREAIGY